MTECIDTVGFIFQKSCVKIKCYKTGCYRYKLAVFKLNKSDFISSTLVIASTPEEAWNGFKNNVSTLLNSDLIISVSKCNKLNSFGAKLVKVKSCTTDSLSLYFSFNIVPLAPSICNSTNSVCIPLTSNSTVPTTSCSPDNYWPDTDYTAPNQTCANLSGNFFYNLECGTYNNVKFFIQNDYCQTPCFKNTTCTSPYRF